MYPISILLFFLYCWSFGLGLGLFTKESEDFLERNLMRLGIGLGALPAFGLLFNLIKVPLDWKIFLIISIISLIFFGIRILKQNYSFWNGLKNVRVHISTIIMLILFLISFYMYLIGAFAYPYLEDDDSWAHATSVKYVSIEKKVFTSEPVFHYIDPYPPTYDMLLGILHQTNNSVYWTLKFFNALIVSLSIIFFYFFVKIFTNNPKKALFSTFALFAVPAFLSHFIWALALTVPLYFVSFYALEKIKDDKKWWFIAAIIMVTTLTSSPTHSTYFGLFFVIYYIARIIAEKKFLIYEFLSAFVGLIISFLVWWLPMILKYGFDEVLQRIGIRGGVGSSLRSLSIAGTGDRIYTIPDFLCHSGTPCYNGVNMINNPIGIGIMLSFLTILGFILLIVKYKDFFTKEKYYTFILVLWFIFSLYSVNGARFHFKISPFRTWMLFAIPVSILSGEAINWINNLSKSIIKNFTKLNKMIILSISLFVLGLIVYSVITTSFIPKYKVNTVLWPPGAFWTSNEELQGYLWFKDNIPTSTKVFTFANNGPIIGLDKFTCHWCPEVREFQRIGINKTSDEIYKWLNKNNYQYIIIDGQTVKKFGMNATNNLLRGLADLNLQTVFQNNGIIILKIQNGT